MPNPHRPSPQYAASQPLQWRRCLSITTGLVHPLASMMTSSARGDHPAPSPPHIVTRSDGKNHGLRPAPMPTLSGLSWLFLSSVLFCCKLIVIGFAGTPSSAYANSFRPALRKAKGAELMLSGWHQGVLVLEARSAGCLS